MQVVTDFHLHSKYSRAVSQQMTLPVMAEFAKQKGLDLLTASDWTHPLWFKEISLLLNESADGIYSLKNDTADQPTRFLLSTEISSIYKQGEKLRRIHSLVFAPSLAVAEKISAALVQKGANLSADGRPIIGLSVKHLLELVLEIDERAFLIPCHVWTPHFGLYGSASGFDSLEEAFGDLAEYIYGVETGLSSDPEMNWQIEELANRSILSFSDAHSPAKMGREATVFLPKEGMSHPSTSSGQVTYEDIRQAIMRKSQKLKIGYTVEFYPEEGKYHYSGHRNCKVSYSPEEIAEKGTICPVCGKRFTEGVMLRVQTLAGEDSHMKALKKQNEYGLQWFTDTKRRHPSYVKLVPLLEIVAEGMGSTVMSQKVRAMYGNLCREFHSEMNVLLKEPIENIAMFAGNKIAESLRKVRSGTIVITPGYDGEYGVVKIWKPGEEPTDQRGEKQMKLL